MCVAILTEVLKVVPTLTSTGTGTLDICFIEDPKSVDQLIGPQETSPTWEYRCDRGW